MEDNTQYEVEIATFSESEDSGSGASTLSPDLDRVDVPEIISRRHRNLDLECAPLTSVEEILTWQDSPHPEWAKKVKKLQPRSDLCASGQHATSRTRLTEWLPLKRSLAKSQPKTLLCHDYNGGYGEDRFVEGSDKYSEYRFFHWAGIDTFVYFSHHLLTIPPLAWINSAHVHGVKVLGTLITEWKDGMATWEKILATELTIDDFAEALAEICHYFGFEGYLLNVENVLKKEDVPKLKEFIISLRENLVDLVPNAEVIWYDSVTVEGHLKWQNQLNSLNKPFFDVCDGIFLNYNWGEEDLRTSIANAGVRALDVYVGVDVFGRGVYGGGGFNSDMALEMIRRFNLSAAIFAPGWTHETQPVQHFTSLEYLFWRKVWPYLNVRGPSQLPFETTFCQGYGLATYKQGIAVHELPWYNLSLQAYQPTVSSDVDETCLHLRFVENIAMPSELLGGCIQHYSGDAFSGGGCLRIQRPNEFTINLKQPLYYQRLFVCDFSSKLRLCISFATKTLSSEETYFSLVIIQEEQSGRYKKLVLVPQDSNNITNSERVVVHPVDTSLDTTAVGQWHCNLNPYPRSGWRQRIYTLAESESKIVEIGVELSSTSQPILLGHLRVQPIEDPTFPE